MRYSDIVSWIAAILSIPLVLLKGILLSIPTLTFVVASKLKCDTFANLNLKLLLKMSNFINIIEKYWIYLISIIFYPKGIFNYQKNKKIIDFLRENADAKEVKYEGLPNNVRDAIEKEGFGEIVAKMIAMFSFLPTYRHAFLNNPFLFEYEMYLTNQESEKFSNEEKMCKLAYSYITDPCYIIKEEKTKGEDVDSIGFTPNYYNDPYDKIINYNNIGMQVAGYYTTFIYLDTINKTPEELYNSIKDKKINETIMSEEHPIYQKIKDLDISLVHNVPFNSKDRFKFLDLVVAYDSLYHVVTGKVEANIQDGNIIEHPMLCLYHNGAVMVYTWNVINDLFTNRVMKFLHKLE